MKKTILITGASRGIGKAIALACANENVNLVLTCNKNFNALESVAELCRESGCNCLTFVGDIGSPENVAELFTNIEQHYEGVDVLVNNAGISHIGLMTDMKLEEWNTIIATNLSSVFYCCHAAVPYMVRKQCGKIINISSVWGDAGASCEVAYSATKGGVNSFTKALGKELAPSNIQVNALALGVIDTEMNRCFSQEEKEVLIDAIPAGRMGTPNEIGKMVASLLDGHEYLTGQVITVDGGFL
ncbi:MAG: 3-oxoacyl-ACP reductase FabG [Eubacteriales bacterium]